MATLVSDGSGATGRRMLDWRCVRAEGKWWTPLEMDWRGWVGPTSEMDPRQAGAGLPRLSRDAPGRGLAHEARGWSQLDDVGVTMTGGGSSECVDGDTAALRRSVRRSKASWWLVESGADGDAGDGCCSDNGGDSSEDDALRGRGDG